MPVVDTDYSTYVYVTYAIALSALAGMGVWSVLRLTAARRKLDAAEGADRDDAEGTDSGLTGPDADARASGDGR